MKTIALPLILSLGLLSLPASGGVIFDNGEPDLAVPGGPFSDFTFGQIIADDFVLIDSQNVIRDIHWWGSYGGPDVPTDDFTIRLYTQDVDRPSATDFQTLSFLAPPERTDLTVPGGPELFLYEVAIDAVTVTPGETLWLSIINNVGDWLWTTSVGGNDLWARLLIGDPPWDLQLGSADRAFRLTDDGTVPAPTTLALISLGLAGLGYRRHREGTAKHS